MALLPLLAFGSSKKKLERLPDLQARAGVELQSVEDGNLKLVSNSTFSRSRPASLARGTHRPVEYEYRRSAIDR